MRATSRRSALSVTAAGLVAALGVSFSPTAAAAPAVPGRDGAIEPAGRAPEVLFVEDFENGVATTPIMLDQYVGADGTTYTADPRWIDASQCNGIVISADSSNVAACDSNDKLKALGDVLGQVTDEDPRTNHVVSAWTSSRDLPANAVQIESLQDFSLGARGRFVSFGVSAAAGACVGFAHPLLDFLLVDGDAERPVSDRALNPCTDSRSQTYTAGGQSFKAGEYVSSGGILFSGESLRWRLRNAQSSSSGNDAAIDRVTIVDSTPTLANEFSGEPIVGDTARMTVRVVNTSEHGSKPGWSFSERLPDGLTVAESPSVTSTCANPETSIEAGGSDVSVRGDLAIDAEDCAVSFDVTATTPGTYTIDGSDVSDAVGLDLPAAASITFAPEQNALDVDERAVLTGGNGDATADLGEQVSFVTTVTNRGNVLVRDLDISGTDGDVPCETTELAPGESVECATDARTVTQSDVDAGSITDEVEVTATSRLGATVRADASASVSTTPVASAAELSIAPVTTEAPGVGDTVGLRARVTNSGNVSIKDLAVTIDGRPEMTVRCDAPTLAPGASIDCAVDGAYSVTQEDVDRGSIAFAAELAATDASGAAVTSAARTSQETVTQAPAVGVTLTPTLDTAGKAPVVGDEVALALSVRNTGNVTLTDVAGTIAEHEDLVAECPTGPLAPGASIECTLPSYVLTQGDIDSGQVEFDAAVTATGPKGDAVAGADSASVTVDRQHGIVAVASAGLKDSADAPEAGDAVALEVAVRNSGNVTLRDVTVQVDGRDLDVECAENVLAPGADTSCAVADHTLTQEDVDSGAVSFGVTVTAAAPGGRTASATDEATVELVRAPAIAASATSVLDANDHEVPLAGDTATVTMTVRNTGNVTVTGVRGEVTDRERLEVDCPVDELAPGESVECEVSRYALTQADVDRGEVLFEVQAAGTGSNRERVEAVADTTLSIVRAPSITTSASVGLDETDHGMTVAGDSVSGRLLVENTGNVTVRNVSGEVRDRDGITVTCDGASIAPGGSTECILSGYELTQGDIDAGGVEFDITAVATGSNGQVVRATATAGTEIVRVPEVDVTVVAHLAASEHEVPQAGDHVEVSVSARNTGNVTLASTSAEIVELADLPVACAPDGFGPGAELECTVPDHVLTQADIDRGTVTIAAVLDATGPGGETVNGRDEARVGLTAKSVLDVTAEPMVTDSSGAMVVLDEERALRPGDQVWVRYSVANTGNLAVSALQQADGMPVIDPEQTDLQPGAVTTATTSVAHTVTDAEAEAGEVVLVGQVKGQVSRTDGDSVEEPGKASTGQIEAPEATVTSTAVEPTAAEQTGEQKLQQLRKPVWVFSTEVRTTVAAEPAPIELAFTGTEIVQVAVPASIVGLLTGLLLLLWSRRRRTERERDGRHRA